MAAATAGAANAQAFMDAVAADKTDVVRAAVSANAQAVAFEDEDEFTALMVAAGCGSLGVMQILLDEGANADDADPAGRTALLVAAAENQPRSLAALAADEATRTQRLAARTSSGNTALHRASAYGGVAIIRAVLGLYTLLRRSTLAVDAVNAVNDKGRTPLVRAARWGRVEEARELLRAGADAGIEDKEGMTAAAWARRKGHTDVLEALEASAAGADGDAEVALSECAKFAEDLLAEVKAAMPGLPYEEEEEEDEGAASPSAMQAISLKGRTFSVVGGAGLGLDEPAQVEGWMAKKGHLFRSWRNRWFVLDGTTMSYFGKPGDKKPKGSLEITPGTEVEARPDYHRPCVFGVRTPKKEFLFQAADDDELDEWLRAIQARIDALG